LPGRKIDTFASNRIKKAGGITNQQDFSIRHTQCFWYNGPFATGSSRTSAFFKRSWQFRKFI
jgi:hypothetical protein